MLCYCVISYVAILRSTTVNIHFNFNISQSKTPPKNLEKKGGKYIISVYQCHFLLCWQVIFNKINFLKCFSLKKKPPYTTIPVWPLICHLDGKPTPLLTPQKTVLLHSFLVLDVWFCFRDIWPREAKWTTWNDQALNGYSLSGRSTGLS